MESGVHLDKDCSLGHRSLYNMLESEWQHFIFFIFLFLFNSIIYKCVWCARIVHHDGCVAERRTSRSQDVYGWFADWHCVNAAKCGGALINTHTDHQDLMVMWSPFHSYHMKASYCVNSRWAPRQFDLGAADTLTLKCYVRTGTDRWRQSELKGCKSKINWTHSWNSAKTWIETVNWRRPCANANGAWVNSSKEKKLIIRLHLNNFGLGDITPVGQHR